MPFISGLVDFEQVLSNQIIAARMAESALKDLEGEADDKFADLQTVLDEADAIKARFEAVGKERDELR